MGPIPTCCWRPGRCLAGSVAPELSGTVRYHTLVVANLCSILARQWQLGPGQRSAATDELRALLGHPPAPTGDRTEGSEGVRAGRPERTRRLVTALDELLRHHGSGLDRDTMAHRLGSIAAVHPGYDSILPLLRADVERRLAINRPGYGIDPGPIGTRGRREP